LPSQHKHPAISFRPPAEAWEWLKNRATESGRAVNAILAEALSEYRTRHDPETPDPKENDR
jgi:hypothetical protein